jgi:hypothetical protein
MMVINHLGRSNASEAGLPQRSTINSAHTDFLSDFRFLSAVEGLPKFRSEVGAAFSKIDGVDEP